MNRKDLEEYFGEKKLCIVCANSFNGSCGMQKCRDGEKDFFELDKGKVEIYMECDACRWNEEGDEGPHCGRCARNSQNRFEIKEWEDDKPKIPGWISTDEAMPNLGTRVVVCRYNGEIRIAHRFRDDWKDRSGWEDDSGNLLLDNSTEYGIIAWMPLPDAVKRNENGQH